MSKINQINNMKKIYGIRMPLSDCYVVWTGSMFSPYLQKIINDLLTSVVAKTTTYNLKDLTDLLNRDSVYIKTGLLDNYGSRKVSYETLFYITGNPSILILNMSTDSVYNFSYTDVLKNDGIDIVLSDDIFITIDKDITGYKDNTTIPAGIYQVISMGSETDAINADKIFSEAELVALEKSIEALNAEYSPIENTSVLETSKDTVTTDMSNTSTAGKTETTTNNTSKEIINGLKQTTTNDLKDDTTNDNTNQRTDNLTQNINITRRNNGFDSPVDAAGNVTGGESDIQNNTGTQQVTDQGTITRKNTGTQTAENSGTDTEKNTGNITIENKGSDITTDKGTVTTEHSSTRHGNIGVTTNQQMITAELELRRNNICDNIIMIIANKLCDRDF